MVEIVKSLSELFNPDILIENVYAFSVLAIFLTMYGPRLHTRLPPSLMALFDNMAFRSAILFLIVYMSHRDFIGALTIVIIFSVTMNILHTHDVLKNIGTITSSATDRSHNVINNSLNTTRNIAGSLIDLGIDTVHDTVDTVHNTGLNSGSVLSNTVNNVSGLVGNTLENVNNVVNSTAHNTAEAVKSNVHNMAEIVDTTTGLAANTVGNVAGLAANTVGDTAHVVSNTVGDVAGLAANTLTDVTDLATGTASNLIGTTSDVTSDIIGLTTSNMAEAAGFVNDSINVEHFSANGPPVSKCAAYDTTNRSSNTHYPLNDNAYAANLRGGNNNVTHYNSTF